MEQANDPMFLYMFLMISFHRTGKSTLMRYIANYKIPGLTHLRILLVDQHVEGDEHTALEWVLRADVERTSLLEDEKRLLYYLHGGDSTSTEADVALPSGDEGKKPVGKRSAVIRPDLLHQLTLSNEGQKRNPNPRR